MNINFRVFRRNNKNLILLWSSKTLTAEQQENLRAYVVEAGKATRELAWRPFVPDNPDKFAPDVAGIVLSHSSNGLDPAEKCVVRVVFGTEIGEVFEIDKDVDPANAATDRPAATRPPAPAAAAAVDMPIVRSHLFAYNYESKEWVPLPWTAALQGQTILVQEQK